MTLVTSFSTASSEKNWYTILSIIVLCFINFNIPVFTTKVKQAGDKSPPLI